MSLGVEDRCPNRDRKVIVWVAILLGVRDLRGGFDLHVKVIVVFTKQRDSMEVFELFLNVLSGKTFYVLDCHVLENNGF
jgi:hypothetical protein